MKTLKVKIAELKQHPLQQDVFGDLNNDEFESLKADIETNGLHQPPEVTADLTLIDGHQRVRVYEVLGRTEIEVIVREDLDENGVDEAFISANLLRRHLDIVAKARACRAFYKAQCKRAGQGFYGENSPMFQKFIAKKLGVSGRTLDRHMQLLELPRGIQDAVSARELAMTKALKVRSLPRPEWEELKRRIDGGESAAKVVNEFITKPQKKIYSPKERFQVLVDLLGDNVAQFETRQTELAEIIAGNKLMTAVIYRSGDLFIQLHELAEAIKNSTPTRSNKASKARQRPR